MTQAQLVTNLTKNIENYENRKLDVAGVHCSKCSCAAGCHGCFLGEEDPGGAATGGDRAQAAGWPPVSQHK